jgi:HK97 family phage prohead protease
MQHLTLKAATTAQTDQGIFEAVISAASVDREKDVVDPAGFVRALQKWVPTGKKIPLAWQHSTAPEDQIGYIDPSTARVQGGEVVASGWIDQTTEVGAHAWRLVKTGTLGFSFGYLVPDGGAEKGAGGVRRLVELDVFEVTATPIPMNNDTRVLGWKQAPAADETEDEAAGDTDQMLADMIDEAQEFIDAEPDPQDVAAMRDILAALQDLASTESTETDEGGGKAVWSTAYINSLPDSSFLYIAPGGSKDSEGKTTPRSLRYFPVKDAGGNVDMVHVRNALSRIPQANIPQSVKDRCTAKAQRMLNASKAAEVAADEAEPRAADPLRRKVDALILEVASDGESLRKATPKPVAPKAEPQYSPKELREVADDLTLLKALTGVD